MPYQSISPHSESHTDNHTDTSNSDTTINTTTTHTTTNTTILIQHNKEYSQDDIYIPQTPCISIYIPQTPCTPIKTSSHHTPLSQLNTLSPLSPQPEYIESLADIDRSFLSLGDHQPLNPAIPFANNLYRDNRPCRIGIRGDGSCALGALLRVVRPDIEQTIDNIESYLS